MRWLRSITRSRIVRVVTVAVAVVACPPSDSGTEPSCAVTSVGVQPSQVTLMVNQATTVTAALSTSNCATAPAIAWSSSDPSAVSIQANGTQAQLTGLQATAAAVTVTATALTASASALVTVTLPPAIAVSPAALSFTAQQGAANPASQTVTITNAGGGTLSGLAVGSVTYGPGASGWLQLPTLSGTTASPSVTMTVQAVTGALMAGTYTATIPVQSGVATNSPQITVTFTVTPPPPAIALNPTSRSFTATQGGGNPASQTATITNSGGGTLSGLSVGTVTYGAGASGWLQAPTLSGTTANPSVTLTLQPVTGSLTPGTYTATVPVQSGVASNSPQNVTVTFTVSAPAPAIALNPTSLAFSAGQGGADPASQMTTITNGGTGTLSGLTVGTVTYGAGASGWLQAPVLSGTTANPSVTLTVQPVTGALTPGTYTATVPVQSGGATNSPQNLSVTFTVLAPGPAIALSAATLNFTATVGGPNPASAATTITNSGTGTLSGLSVGTVVYGAGASGWLQAPTLSGTTANPSVTLTLQPITGSLTAGSYAATVPVLSAVASNSPQDVTVNFTVNPPGADPCLFANATPIAVGQTINGALSATTSCLLATGRYADLYVLTLASSTNLVIDLTATYDPFLSLLAFVDGSVIEEDDDDGPGLNSLIARTLAAGQYILRPRSFSAGITGPYALSVQATAPGAPASVAINAGNAQIASPGTNVPIAPSVIVRDAGGFPAVGATVTFATVSTIGSITGAVATTDNNGIATVGSWNLAAGPNVLSATVSGGSITGNPVIFSATGSASAAGFNVTMRFLTMPSLPQLQAFVSAGSRWETIITNDLADINNVVLPPDACASNSPAMNENIDDLVIQVSLTAIDGPGGILGGAGPCFIRTAGSLPVLGAMVFDLADLATLEADGSLNSVILHEMGHVIGIGTLWTEPAFNLLANPSLPSSPGVDTRFTGVNGIAGFDAVGGTTYTGGGKVPVENTLGGPGTRDGHWREGVLANELMTGFLNAGSNPLSVLSVRSLQDLGYSVNTGAADPFFVVLTIIGGGGSPVRVRLIDDIRRGPIHRIDARGRPTDARGRPLFVPAPPKR